MAIEIRLALCSTFMGPLIPLQVGNTALIVFVSYFGSRVHRPRLIGCGAILVTLAGVLMTVPHFISEPYRYDHTSPGKNRRDWAKGGHELPHYCTQGPPPGFQRSRWAQLPRTPTSPPHPTPLPPSASAWMSPSSSPGQWC